MQIKFRQEMYPQLRSFQKIQNMFKRIGSLALIDSTGSVNRKRE